MLLTKNNNGEASLASVNHEHKCVFIHIPKCGGSYIRHILHKYYNFESIDCYEFCINIYKYKSLIDFIKNIYENTYNDYTFFYFVRNPYEKLFSGFCYLMNTNYEEKKGNYNNFIEFIKEREKLNNVEMIHTFITQTNYTKSTHDKILIGNTNRLDNDFITILKKLNFNEIYHYDYIINKICINKSKTEDKFYDNYNIETISIINNIFSEDFDNFNFIKVNNTQELKKIYDNINSEELINFIINEFDIYIYICNNYKYNNIYILINNFINTIKTVFKKDFNEEIIQNLKEYNVCCLENIKYYILYSKIQDILNNYDLFNSILIDIEICIIKNKKYYEVIIAELNNQIFILENKYTHIKTYKFIYIALEYIINEINKLIKIYTNISFKSTKYYLENIPKLYYP